MLRPAPGPENVSCGTRLAQLRHEPDTEGMVHFHVWTRSGRIFTMQPRLFASRHTATKVARRLRPNGADRLVLMCESCPGPRPSRRRPLRWGVVARAVAEAVGAKPADVRVALSSALDAERRRTPVAAASRSS